MTSNSRETKIRTLKRAIYDKFQHYYKKGYETGLKRGKELMYEIKEEDYFNVLNDLDIDNVEEDFGRIE